MFLIVVHLYVILYHCFYIFQNFLISGFLIFIIFNSNPFNLVSPIPKEGLGLNPILQEPALAIHPPLLYIGFVGSSIYFSAAVAALITDYSKKLLQHQLRIGYWFPGASKHLVF